jgi:hypothetical protein
MGRKGPSLKDAIRSRKNNNLSHFSEDGGTKRTATAGLDADLRT